MTIQVKDANNATQTVSTIDDLITGTLTGSGTATGAQRVELASNGQGQVNIGAFSNDGVLTVGSATSAAVLSGFPISMNGFGSVTTYVTSIGSGNTITWETVTPADGQSVVNTTTPWVAVNGLRGDGNFTPSDTSAGVVPRVFSLGLGVGFRGRVSTYGSGTVTAVASQSVMPKQTLVNFSGAPSVTIAKAAQGGLSNAGLVGAATTNASSIKASAGQIYTIHAWNNAATWAYLKLFNKASAPTPGTDTPLLQVAIPPGGTANFGASDIGIPFGTGIAVALTAGAALLDSTALAAASTAGFSMGYN